MMNYQQQQKKKFGEKLKIVFSMGRNYYPQAFLEECKYVIKEKKFPKYIIDDKEISSDSDKENSDKKNSNGENSGEEISSEESSD